MKELSDAHNHDIHIGSEVVGRFDGKLVAGVVDYFVDDYVVINVTTHHTYAPNLYKLKASETTVWNPGHLSTGTEPVQPLP